ncbi:MAG TPA: tetratricopeptide repeat protein [Phycisphaerae bacterium]|nr:tetratricopeptide repeat protein [Phycisphaerae bacterium]
MANRDLASDEPKMWSSRHVIGAAALVVVALLVAYAPAIRGGFIWDDDAHVTKPELRSTAGLYRIWFEIGATQQYYPLLHTAFWIQHKLWGDWPVGYHLVNLTWHAIAAMLVLVIVRRLLRGKRVAGADSGAVLTAAVFALHPVQVESVAWITEQKNTLSAVFYLAAMLSYLRFDETRQRSLYGLATGMFVLGLLTKTVTATLPAAMLVILWWQRGRLSWKRDVGLLLPWFVLGAFGGLMTAWVERDLIGAKGAAFELSFVERFLLAGRVVWFYLYKLFWPGELIFIYPRWSVDAGAVWQWLYPMGLLSVFVGMVFYARRNRAPLAALLFFVGSLFPVLGFFNVYPFIFSFVADHFQYLPSLGVIALVCGGAALSVAKLSSPAARVLGLAILPVVLGVLTHRQCRMYADVQSLYEATIRKNPGCWMAYNNLGTVLDDRGRLHEAIEHYRRALQLRPDYADAHNNLGAALETLGRHGEAAVAHQEALRLRPRFPEARFNLGVAYTGLGDSARAIEQYRLAIQLRPNYPEAHNQLGMTLNATGRHDEAIAAYESALQLRPQYTEAYGNLVAALIDAKLVLDAIDRARDAVRRFPANAPLRVNLGIALTMAGRPRMALSEFEEAARLRPDLFEAQANLAASYESAGRLGEALAAGERALAIAQSTGDEVRGAQIQAWLAACRARAGGSPPRLPSP